MNLYDYGARFYDPRLCSWTSQDPLADKYYGVSSYVYCVGNPIVFVDPNGEHPAISILIWMALEGMAEYGLQVYKNYQDGESGLDAWLYQIDFVDVTAETISPLVKFGIVGDFAVEGIKEAVDLKYEGGFSFTDKPENILPNAITNTLVSQLIKGGVDAGLAAKVKQATNATRKAKNKLNIANDRVTRKPNSQKQKMLLKKAEENLTDAMLYENWKKTLYDTFGKKPNWSKYKLQLIYDFEKINNE